MQRRRARRSSGHGAGSGGALHDGETRSAAAARGGRKSPAERDAMQVALGMLGRRALSAARVRERIAREFGKDEAERVCERLLGLGVLDDRKYAEAFTRDRALRAGYGRARIRRDLLARGISAELADAAIASVVEADAEVERAARALERFRRLRAGRGNAPADARKLREAAFRHLLVKGFETDVIRRVLAARSVGDA